jgi:hypothetical protein
MRWALRGSVWYHPRTITFAINLVMFLPLVTPSLDVTSASPQSRMFSLRQ